MMYPRNSVHPEYGGLYLPRGGCIVPHDFETLYVMMMIVLLKLKLQVFIVEDDRFG